MSSKKWVCRVEKCLYGELLDRVIDFTFARASQMLSLFIGEGVAVGSHLI